MKYHTLRDFTGETPYEEMFSKMLIDYEIPSMVRDIKQQVWLFGFKYRADFLLELTNRNNIIIELDGKQHYTKKGKLRKYDKIRHIEIESLGYFIIHLPNTFLTSMHPETVMNYIQGEIERLGEL